MSGIIEPMLAESGNKSFLDRPDYLYEPKLDGVRCIAFLNPGILTSGRTRLQSRSGQDITARFPELAELHKQVDKYCILDGELASRDFNAIQHRIHQSKPLAIRVARNLYPAQYHVFDIINYDMDSVTPLPLIERKAVLDKALTDSYEAQKLPWYVGEGRKLLEHTEAMHLEGIMAKRIYSPYESKRSKSWLKIKNFRESTFIIAGLTEGEGERADTFGSVILAKRGTDGKLVYVGNVGSGFNQEQTKMLLYLLSFYQAECPFEGKPDVDRPVKLWARPELKLEVRYLELSPNGLLRFPTFRKLVK